MIDDKKDLISQLTVDGSPDGTPITAQAQPQEAPEAGESEEVVAASNSEKQPESLENTLENQPKQPRETDAARNLRAMREQNERLQRERDEAYRLMQGMYENKQPKQQNEDYDINDDDLPEGRHVKQYVNTKLKKNEQEMAQMRQQLMINAVESEMANQYRDFRDVLSPENTAKLGKEYPELAQSILSNPDIKGAYKAAYTAIKQLNIGNTNPDAIALAKNKTKPRSLNSIGAQTTPLSEANNFQERRPDDATLKALRAEMMEKAGNRNVY